MKILYGIQGTGHGHISRAREIVPLLAEKADIDVLISGYNSNMTLEDIEITQKRGLSLAYDSNGSVSFLQTALKIKPARFIQDVHSLDVQGYDLIISDYEPITAWASLNSHTPSIGLSHQAAFLSQKSPRPEKKSLFAEQVLKHFAPCRHPLGFHFQRYDSFIHPPVIRKDVRDLFPERGTHVSVYLPAFDHQTLVSVFMRCRQVEWHVFSPLCREPYRKGHIWVRPVGNKPFLESMKTSLGVITSAGFETCAEAMYLGKKLLIIPIKNQYEQLCNAAALQRMGITAVYNLDATFKNTINEWLAGSDLVRLSETADMKTLTEEIIRFAKKPDLVPSDQASPFREHRAVY